MKPVISAKVDVTPNGVAVSVSAFEVVTAVMAELHEKSQNLIVTCWNAHDWCNGYTNPSLAIRKSDKLGDSESHGDIKTDDISWLIAGDVRWIDNGQKATRIKEILERGYSNAYVDLRAQALLGGILSRPSLGKRKIISMHVIDNDCCQFILAPMD